MDIKNFASKLIVNAKKILKSSIASQAVWMISGGFFQAGLAFASNLVLVRILLPEDFGKFALIQANVSLIGVIISFRIGDLLLKTSKEQLNRKYLSICVGGLALQTLLVGGGTFVLLWLWHLLNLESGILLFSLLLSSWVDLHIRLYERQFNYKKLSWLETISHLVSHLFAAIGALSGIGAIVLYLRELVRLLGLIGGLGYLGAWQKLPMHWLSFSEWQLILKQIRGFWADGVLEQLFGRWIILLIGSLAGEQATGYFFQAQRLVTLPHQFLQPLTFRIAFNYFSHRADGYQKQWQVIKSVGLTAGVLIPTAGLILLSANTVIPMVFGANWQPVAPILIALLGVMVGLTLFNLLKSYFMAQSQMRTFLLFGRGSQYLAIGMAILIVSIFKTEASLSLAAGLSASYILGTLLLIGALLISISHKKVDSTV